MTLDSTHPVEALFLRAVELDPADRPGFLDAQCGADGALRAAVERRLRQSAAADAYLNALAERLGLAHGSVDTPAPQRVGRYAIERLIGRGGMGAVYLARRADDQYEQRVAIKMLPFGLDPSVPQRLIAERQILARLSHPGIAHLLDGGVTDDGAPYFVMEYVDGEPIDAYCDRHRLSIAARLDLFTRVCDAVDYAHRNLVIHRDLKPGNILVTEGGEVKLLDFGIARLLDEEAPRLTAPGGQPLTPRFASPEALEGGAVSTVSDVYALGVILFELLTGQSPYGRAARSPLALLAALQQAEPARPSAAVDDAERRPAALRGLEPGQLRRRLAGDLDAIVLTALRRQPDQRYASAAQLATDIRRSQANLPISARPPTPAYTARKFVRRHSAAVAGAAVAVLALVLVTAVSVRYGVTTARQAEQIARERDRAEQTQAFLLSLFEAADPNQARGATVTAKQLVDQGARRVEAELVGLDQAQTAETIGGIYLALGLYDQAAPMLELATRTYRQQLGSTSLEHIRVLDERALLAEIRGDYATSRALAERALTLSTRSGDPEAIALARTRLGRILHLMGNLNEAEPHYRAALEQYVALFGEHSEPVAQGLSHLATLQEHLGAFDAAERMLRQALAIRRALFGDEHLGTIEIYINLASAMLDQGRLEDAIAMLDHALALNRKLLGDEHRDNAFIYNHRAHAREELGDYAGAEADLRRAGGLLAANLGVDHPDYGIMLANLGKLLMHNGDHPGAREAFQGAYQVLSGKLPDHWIPFDVARLLAETLVELEHDERAEVLFRTALAGLDARRGPDHETTRAAAAGLIALLESQDRHDEAEPLRNMVAGTNDTSPARSRP